MPAYHIPTDPSWSLTTHGVWTLKPSGLCLRAPGPCPGGPTRGHRMRSPSRCGSDLQRRWRRRCRWSSRPRAHRGATPRFSPCSGSQHRPYPVPGSSRLRDRRDEHRALTPARARIPCVEQPPPFTGHQQTGMVGPARVLGTALHDGPLRVPAMGVIRRGHVKATDLSIEAPVHHQSHRGS
jgi:hypothetical protein